MASYKFKKDWNVWQKVQTWVAGGLLAKPVWFDAVRRVPPPRLLPSDLPKMVKFPEEKLYQKLLLKHPVLRMEQRQQHPLEGQRQTSFERINLYWGAGHGKPIGTHILSTIGPRFTQRQYRLITQDRMPEEDAFALCEREFATEIQHLDDTVMAAIGDFKVHEKRLIMARKNPALVLEKRLRKIKQITTADLQTVFEIAERNGATINKQPHVMRRIEGPSDVHTASSPDFLEQKKTDFTQIHSDRATDRTDVRNRLTMRLMKWVQKEIELKKEPPHKRVERMRREAKSDEVVHGGSAEWVDMITSVAETMSNKNHSAMVEHQMDMMERFVLQNRQNRAKARRAAYDASRAKLGNTVKRAVIPSGTTPPSNAAAATPAQARKAV